MSTNNTQLKKQTLKTIANDLRKFDFGNFDPRTDKTTLMNHLQIVNSKLGKMIRKLTDEEKGSR